MSNTESDASQERPLFALDPVVVLDVICICEDGIQRQEGDSVQVCICWYRLVKCCSRDFRRLDLDGHPVCRVVGFTVRNKLDLEL